MTAVIPLDPVAIFAGPYAPLALLALAAWALVNCFGGYPLFRVVLVIHGVLGGWATGAVIATWLRAEPAAADYAIAGGAMAVLLGMTAWFVCRAAFAVGVFWLTMVTIAQLTVNPGTGAWIVSGLLGIVAGIAAYRQLRNAIIFITAVCGAVVLVLAGALLCTGGQGWGDLMNTIFAEHRVWLAWLLSIVALVLAGAGIFAQAQLAELVSDVYMPRERGKKRTRRPRGTRVYPRFTKL